MNRFDTIKIRIPKAYVKIRPEIERYFEVSPERPKPGYDTPIGRFPKSLMKPGLNELVSTWESVLIRISSKILGSQYRDLISLETLPAVLQELSKIVDLNSDILMKHAEVLLCHVTANVPISEPAWRYLLAMACISNPGFKIDTYKLKEIGFERIETVSFQKRYRGQKVEDYFSAYDKEQEMLSKGKKNSFYRSLKNFDKTIEFFRTHLRVELQIRNFSSIRKAFDLKGGALLLSDILNSKTKPLYSYLEGIRGESKGSGLEIPEGKTFREMEISRGMDGYIRDFNYDMNLIKPFIRKVSSGTSNKDICRYQKRTEELKLQKNGINAEKAKGLLDEIEDWLKEN